VDPSELTGEQVRIMKTVEEEARRIPVISEHDVCVVGGSCTGVFAAIAAARLGADVALVEDNGFFGGCATAGLVNVWHSLHDTSGRKRVIGGLTLEVIERLEKRNAVTRKGREGREFYVFNSAELVIELDEMVEKAGVTPFLHTRFVSPLLDSERLEGIAVEDKSGRRAITAANFVDATGDGTLIHRMGLPCRTHEAMQPPTMCALLQGLGGIRSTRPDFSLGDVAFDPKYPEALSPGFLWSSEIPGLRDMTMVAGTRVFGSDCSDAAQLTEAEMEGRKQVRAICDILRNHFLPRGESPLVALPSHIGVRETRHAGCLHTLTEEEVLRGVRFPDAIANGTYRVDIHHTDGPGVTFRYLDGRETYLSPGERKEGLWLKEGEDAATFYQIPYRSLVPRGTENVLAAGRTIDADPGAYGAIRVMVNCNQTGEAAGTASYLSQKQGLPVSDVDTQELRETMAGQGSVVL
jgi:hypothetical protein